MTAIAAPEAVRRPSRWPRRRRRLRRVAEVVLVVVLTLHLMDTQVRTPVGAEGVGRGSFPVVEVAGLGSNGRGFADLTRRLEGAGTTVLDFDPGEPGTQPLVYRPTSASTHVADLAVDVVLPAIRTALTRAGLDPDTQVVDVVAHSMGGLLMRYLVEHPVDGWSTRVDDLVMVGTPNHGSDLVYWETRGGGPFKALGADMRPGSALLTALGYAEPPGQVYTTIGGDPWMFRWYRFGDHGFDDQVPAESPFLDGAAHDTFAALHGDLLKDDDLERLVLATLAAGG